METEIESLPELARFHLLFPLRWVVFARTCSISPSISTPTGGFCPNLLDFTFYFHSDGWFLSELARFHLLFPLRWVVFARTCSISPSISTPMGGFCPNLLDFTFYFHSDGWFLPELARFHLLFPLRWVVFARTCSISPSISTPMGGFCPNLLDFTFYFHSDGWFLPELAQKNLPSDLHIPVSHLPVFTVCPARFESPCQRVVFARTCPKNPSSHRHIPVGHFPVFAVCPAHFGITMPTGGFCPNLHENGSFFRLPFFCHLSFCLY